MKIGLFFGSFNPIHIGHLIIANHAIEYAAIDQLWFVISPHSPFKKKSTLAPDYDRLHLVQIAIQEDPRLKASSIEFSLPQPSYTIDTLAYLKEKYPKNEFALIMGSDNLKGLHKWKNYEILIKEHPIYVYNRPGEINSRPYPDAQIEYLNGPLLHISASFIREQLKQEKSIRYLVHDTTYKYLSENKIYK